MAAGHKSKLPSQSPACCVTSGYFGVKTAVDPTVRSVLQIILACGMMIQMRYARSKMCCIWQSHNLRPKRCHKLQGWLSAALAADQLASYGHSACKA